VYNVAALASEAVLVQAEFLFMSVGRSVGNDREFWKNGELDRDATLSDGSGGPIKPCIIRWGPATLTGTDNFGADGWRHVMYNRIRLGRCGQIFPNYFGIFCLQQQRTPISF